MNSRVTVSLRLLAALAFILALAWAGAYSIRIYMADRLVETVTIENLEKAVRLAPGNSNGWARLGALLERQGESQRAAQALENAVRLDPYNGPAWVDLGLHWELEGDAQRALKCLTDGLRLDRSFYVRWALVNFYLRQGKEERFWTTIREAISHTRSDLTAAFDLCWRASSDPDQILDQAIPNDIEVYRQYHQFLVATRRTAALAGVWKRIEGRLDVRDLDLGLRYADLLLAERQADSAVEVWNRLCAAGLLPFQPLEPGRGAMLTNGKFQFPPSSLGFDWRLGNVDGVVTEVETFDGEPRLAIRFNGAHPEGAELLSQWTPVEANRAYRLTFQYTTRGLPAASGLHWLVFEDASPGERPLDSVEAPPLSASDENWTKSEIAFRTGPKTRLVRVVLAYRRSPGTARSEGSVLLGSVELWPDQRPSGASKPARGAQH